MNDYKSVQDLIVKAAMYDKVTTTIRSNEFFGGIDVVEIIFSKKDRCSAVNIDVHHIDSINEEMVLYECKKALHKLLWEPYEEIEYAKEN